MLKIISASQRLATKAVSRWPQYHHPWVQTARQRGQRRTTASGAQDVAEP
eukprot:COSAG01_NODE_16438_length_1236_cov_3.922603_1_plen_49_part_10